MARKVHCGIGFFLLLLFSCTTRERIPDNILSTFPDVVTVTVHNPIDCSRTDASVFLDVQKLQEKCAVFNPDACIVWCGGAEIPSQFDSGTPGPGRIVFVADFTPGETKRISLCSRQGGVMHREYPKRTQAELAHKMGGTFVGKKYIGGTFMNVTALLLPPQHTDHDEFIRYEGPGWESDKVGYRYYLDWRNAIDIFGKKTPRLVLQDVGQDGYDSYHSMGDWGMDIFQVGESLGIGTVGMWLDGKAQRVAETDSVFCQIAANGPVLSRVHTEYYGWKAGSSAYHLTSDLSITGGSRITVHDLTVQGVPDNLCTGLAKNKEAHVVELAGGTWAFLALWGKQSLNGDSLGTAVLYRKSDLVRVTEDAASHVVVLTPGEGRLTYGFLAAWEKEEGGIRSEKEFIAYLNQVLEEWDHPLIVRYSK